MLEDWVVKDPELIQQIVGHDAEHPIEEWDLVEFTLPFWPNSRSYKWVQKLPKCSCGKDVVPGSDLCEECNGTTMP